MTTKNGKCSLMASNYWWDTHVAIRARAWSRSVGMNPCAAAYGGSVPSSIRRQPMAHHGQPAASTELAAGVRDPRHTWAPPLGATDCTPRSTSGPISASWNSLTGACRTFKNTINIAIDGIKAIYGAIYLTNSHSFQSRLEITQTVCICKKLADLAYALIKIFMHLPSMHITDFWLWYQWYYNVML